MPFSMSRMASRCASIRGTSIFSRRAVHVAPLLISMALLACSSSPEKGVSPAAMGGATGMGGQTGTGGANAAAPTVRIDRTRYLDRLHAMWLGQCIANWTGLRTEGRIVDAPFLTDQDWGGSVEGNDIDFVFQDPWGSDDDTDIEYVYLHAAHTTGTPWLTPAVLGDAWTAHINEYIWVSNERVRELIGGGLLPPATGLPVANPFTLEIDAQLTTETFGLYAPGLPVVALELADLPIRASSRGYAAHAAQFHVLLHSLAAIVDETLPLPERIDWLVQQSRAFIPDESKTADVIDFVYDHYSANADKSDWESTRDAVYQRYHVGAAANGFVYRDWYESSVNLAGGLIALLYGGGDYKKTVQIGTLSGWDSDNGTATMGALVGFLIGTDALRAAFPDQVLSDRYWIYRTRDDLPDYLPTDPEAEDTLSAMAERMMALVDKVVARSGGVVGSADWQVPHHGGSVDPGRDNPLSRDERLSGNVSVRRAKGQVAVTSTGSVAGAAAAADGLEADASGVEWPERLDEAALVVQESGTVTLELRYDREVSATGIRLVRGSSFESGPLVFELLVNDAWQEALTVTSPSNGAFLDESFELPKQVKASGVRLRSNFASGSSIAELDVVIAP